MFEVRHVMTHARLAASHMTSVSDLMALEGPDGPMLALLSRYGDGGLALLNLAAAAPSLITRDLPDRGATLGAERLIALEEEGGTTLYAFGLSGPHLAGYRLNADGTFGAARSLDLGRVEGRDFSLAEATFIDTRQGGFLVGVARDAPGLLIWQRGSDGEFTLAAPPQNKAIASNTDVSALLGMTLGGQGYVVAASLEGPRIDLFELAADGKTTLVQSLSPQDGLFISAPHILKSVSIGAEQFILAGASESNSIVVLKAMQSGRLEIVDQINDSGETRFEGVTALDVIEVDGRVFVAAVGMDDGLSLLSLLPNGRLIHLQSIADDTQMALGNAGTVSLWQEGDTLGIAVVGDDPTSSTGADMALSQFVAEIGPSGETHFALGAGEAVGGSAGNDQLIGGSGNDRLSAQGGSDVLFDGAGSDTMFGGAGADLFVMDADMRVDWISDFELGIDRIDLSAWRGLYDPRELVSRREDGGLHLQFGNEELFVHAASGGAYSLEALLKAESFQRSDTVFTAPLPPSNLVLQGSQSADFLLGYAGDDSLIGGSGGDRLQGGAGDDFIHGGSFYETWDPYLEQVVRLYQATLDRAPDPAGLYGWAKMLADGTQGLISVAAGFVGSPEFQLTYGASDDEEFVTQLYFNVLDRAPDAAGLSGWTEHLARPDVSRAHVVIGFSESPEFVASMKMEALLHSVEYRALGWSDDVFRLYQATLARAPDRAGYLAWGQELGQGRPLEEVVSGFVLSVEFQQTYGALDPKGFVALLYENVLDRAPDSAGLAYWSGALQRGELSREGVVLGFSQSPEFIAKTQADYADWAISLGRDDRLEGGAGTNLLFGGRLRDEFVFDASERSRNDLVGLEDFDLIVLNGFGYSAPSDVFEHMTQHDGYVEFSDSETTITLWARELENLSHDMFAIG